MCMSVCMYMCVQATDVYAESWVFMRGRKKTLCTSISYDIKEKTKDFLTNAWSYTEEKKREETLQISLFLASSRPKAK